LMSFLYAAPFFVLSSILYDRRGAPEDKAVRQDFERKLFLRCRIQYIFYIVEP
jgi:hypothetical protein